MLYECLTGQVPFTKDQDVATLFAHLEDEPPRVSTTRPNLPKALNEVVVRAMAKRKEDRFPTCSAFAQAAVEASRADDAAVRPIPAPTVLAPPPQVPARAQPESLPPQPTHPEPLIPAPPSQPIPVASSQVEQPGDGGRKGGPRWLLIGALVVAVAAALAVGAVALGGGGSEGADAGPTAGATGSNGASGATAPAPSGPVTPPVTNASTLGCTGPQAPSDLPDGTYFGYLQRYNAFFGRMEFDLACFYQGQEANQQAQQRGDEVPVPNDVYIVDDNPYTRELSVASQPEILLIDWNDCCRSVPGARPGAFATALRAGEPVEVDGWLFAGTTSPYWVTIEQGSVVAVQEQFLP